jgi:DNA-binding transcriptional MerR regulator
MKYALALRSTEDGMMYTRSAASRIARISTGLLLQCEQEGLLQTRVMTGGGRGYSEADIRQMAVIRRLLYDLELDLSTVDVVIHMRQQVIDLLDQIEEVEYNFGRREQQLLGEIIELRRQLSVEVEY